MAKLTASQRHSVLMKHPKEFALSGGRFPINDKNHAKAALIDVGRANISSAQKATVRAKARAKLRGN